MRDGPFVTKTKIAASHPDGVLHKEKHENDNRRDGALTVSRKTEQELLDSKPTSGRINMGQMEKDPCHENASQLAFEEKVLKGFVISCTKAARIHIHVEPVCQPGTCIKNPMSNLPVEIENGPIQMTQVQLVPCLGPVQGTVGGQKLCHTMWRRSSSRA